MTKYPSRISVQVGGQSIKLASLRVSKDDSLYIAVDRGDKFRDAGLLQIHEGSPAHGADTQEFRISIHPSPHSLDKNRINVHDVLRGGNEQHTSGETSAIKAKDGFVHLFSRRGCSYDAPRKRKSGEFCIGEFDMDTFTLFYSLFVSHSSLEFRDTLPDANVCSFTVGDFRITIIWSLFPLMNPPNGLLIALSLSSANTEGIHQLVELHPDDVADFHRQASLDAFAELSETILNNYIFNSYADRALFKSTILRYCLMKSGSKNSLEYKIYEANCPPLPNRLINVGYLGSP